MTRDGVRAVCGENLEKPGTLPVDASGKAPRAPFFPRLGPTQADLCPQPESDLSSQHG